MLLLIDNYDSFTYNLVHFLGDLGARCMVHRNDQITVDAAMALNPAGIVLSPGPCTPNEAGICMDLIKAAAKAQVPLFGVCLGHQAVGQAFGGKVVRAPTPDARQAVGYPASGPERVRGRALPVRGDALSLSDRRARQPAQRTRGHGANRRHHHGAAPQDPADPWRAVPPESIASQHGHKILENFLKIAGGHPTQQKKAA
jgi:anthranilate/para-aminobenzoate synthase component II